MPTLFGSAIKRREDPRLITGAATYVDDVKLPGLTYAAIRAWAYGLRRMAAYVRPGSLTSST
jgi:carbon-monoxide dehydrogenase large subunit